MKQLYEILKKSDNYFASTILEECNSFKKFKALQYQEDTSKTNDAEYILGEMHKRGSINSHQKLVLKTYYEKFDK